jgi:hypothetical protein
MQNIFSKNLLRVAGVVRESSQLRLFSPPFRGSLIEFLASSCRVRRENGEKLKLSFPSPSRIIKSHGNFMEILL